jgi:hypothetical protein
MTFPEMNELVSGAVGAALSYGLFVGSTRANLRSIKEILTRVEKKIDSVTDKVNDHEVKIAVLSVKKKESTDAPSVSTASA